MVDFRKKRRQETINPDLIGDTTWRDIDCAYDSQLLAKIGIIVLVPK